MAGVTFRLTPHFAGLMLVILHSLKSQISNSACGSFSRSCEPSPARLETVSPEPSQGFHPILTPIKHPIFNYMNKALFIALLVGGVILAIFGMNASNSFGSDVSRFFTGSPTDKAVWMLIGGVVMAVAGLAGLAMGGKKT